MAHPQVPRWAVLLHVGINTFTCARARETCTVLSAEPGGRRRPQREAVTILPPWGQKQLCSRLAFVQVPLTSIMSFREEHTSKVGKGIIKQRTRFQSQDASKEFYGPWRLGWQKRDAWERHHKSFTAPLLGDWLNLQLPSSLHLETLGSSASLK